jgi:membrane protease YdiL (CAAX protease family)
MLETGRADASALLLCFFGAVALAAATTAAVSGFGLSGPPEKFARKALIPAFLLLYVFADRKGRPKLLDATALRPRAGDRRLALIGFATGAAALAAFLGASLAAGFWVVRDPIDPWTMILGKGVYYVFAGLVLATWEEGLFRGLLFGDVERAAGTRAAIVATTLVFAISHLLGPPAGTTLDWSAPWIGPKAAWANVAGLSRAIDAWPHLLGLAIVGFVLARLRARVGSAWLCVGVHAGWFYVMQMDGRFFRFAVPDGSPRRLWSGSPEYCDGAAGWIALLFTYLVAAKLVPAAKPASESHP